MLVVEDDVLNVCAVFFFETRRSFILHSFKIVM